MVNDHIHALRQLARRRKNHIRRRTVHRNDILRRPLLGRIKRLNQSGISPGDLRIFCHIRLLAQRAQRQTQCTG